MDKIYDYNLVKFDETSDNHEYAVKKIKDYRFDTNFELLREFSGNEFLCDLNTTKFVIGGHTLAIRFSNGYSMISYLIDCFNVYKKTISSGIYEKDIELSKKWRIIMQNTYPDSTYYVDAKNFLFQEREELVKDVCESFDDQLESLYRKELSI